MKIPRYSLYSLFAVCALIVIPLALPPCRAADDPRDAAVDQDMQRMKTAMTTSDFATLIDLMYKPIVQACGGKETMLAQAKSTTDQASFTSFEAIKPYTYYIGTDNDYVVLTTHFVLVLNGHHIDFASFELGIKPHKGGNWEYVDGSGVKPATRDKFFPDLPKDVVLPEVKRTPMD